MNDYEDTTDPSIDSAVVGPIRVAGEELIVGRMDSIPAHVLHQVRGAIWKPHESLVIANGVSGELRIFDRDARHVRTVGRIGGGPGEHQLLVALWRAAADSLITYDARNSRVSYWTAHGDFSRDIAVDPGTRIVGPLSPGWFLGVRLPPQFPLADGKTRTDTAVFVRVSPAADSTIHLALSPWQTYYGATTPAGDVLTTPLPLEPKGVAAIGTSTVYIGYGNAWRIEQYSLAGEQLESIIAAIERRPLTGELRDRWQAPFLEKVSLRERPAMRRYLSSLPYPDSLPAMDLMIVDELENLWIRQFALPAEDSATWFVFSSQGEQVATLRLSTTLRPLQIGDDFLVAGVSREALGEEVVVFALER